MTRKNKNLIVIVGPTAVGKTALAIQIARHFHTEIVSADARQFYKEMSIGTAKPTIEELASTKHYLIDNLNITDEYNAGKFEKDALNILSKILNTSDFSVMVGGSGLFIKAVCDGFDEMPDIDPNIRISLTKNFEENGAAGLLEQLKQLDPVYFNQVDQFNTQRVIRALEVCIGTGKPFSYFRHSKKAERDFKIIKIGLTMDRDLLYNRIDTRVDQMMKDGLIDEVKSLVSFKNLNSLQTVGYTEIFDYLDGRYNLDETIRLIKRNSRHYAKRQLTWFNKDEEIKWFHPEELNQILTYISSKS